MEYVKVILNERKLRLPAFINTEDGSECLVVIEGNKKYGVYTGRTYTKLFDFNWRPRMLSRVVATMFAHPIWEPKLRIIYDPETFMPSLWYRKF